MCGDAPVNESAASELSGNRHTALRKTHYVLTCVQLTRVCHLNCSLSLSLSLSFSLSLSLPFASHFSPLAKFLGNQLLSYGQTLWIRFLSETPELLPQSVSVVMEGF